MKIKNKLIVICLIFFILISISAVSAENNNTDVISITNNDDAISIDNLNDNEILSTDDGSFASLNKTINGGSSTTITLERDYSYSSADTIKEGIVINKDNLTIDGKGHMIDAKCQSRIFYVNSTTVYLKNIQFINGNANFENITYGGAVYGYGDNLRIINCTFINNTASGWGGAVYSYPDSLAVIANSTFINNGAKNGGAVSVVHGYRQYVINSTFDSNHASTYGGAIAVYGTQATTERPYDDKLTVDGCLFIGNNAPYGDAISNIRSASLDIKNSILLGNCDNIIFNDVYFAKASNNWFGNTYDNRSSRPNLHKSIEMDGWLYMDLVPDLATSSATVSINNIYDEASGKTTTYSANKLPSIAVNVNADHSIIGMDKVVLDHSGKASFDFAFQNDTVFTASYQTSTISKKVKGGSFDELQGLINAAQDGDVITLEKDYVYINGVDTGAHGIQITNKHNLVIDGNGHSVNANGNSRIFTTDKVSNNIVFKNLNIANGYLYSNTELGAGLYLVSDNSELVNCSFTNNVADTLTGGAALYVHASHIDINGCRFINNTHEYSTAGAAYLRGEDITIRNTLFENNSAVGYAGAILSYDECDIVNCTFKNNSAPFAGATFNWGHANIRDSTFIANRAIKTDSSDVRVGSAGAIYAANTTISNCVFTYNDASMGAAIAVASNETDIDRCVFINNSGKYNGVIFSFAEGGKVANSIFLNNDVSGYVISNLYYGFVVEYCWFGNIWYKNKWSHYDTEPEVSNLATMKNWLFLNATDFIFDDNGNFNVKFTFLEYDNATGNIIQYDDDDLPEIDLYLSAQNLTLNKNVVNAGQTIEGSATSYKGVLYAECENVKYELPFKHLIESRFEVNSTINVYVENSLYVPYNLIPFESDYLPFLVSNNRVTITSNDTSVAKIVSKASGLYVTGVKPGVALLTLKFNGINVMGEDKYTPSNATLLVNVSRIPTHIEFIYDVEDMGIGESGNIMVSARDYKNKSVYGSGLEYVNNNETVLRLAGNSFRTLSEGLANVTVVYAGSNKYEPCSLDVTFKVGKKQLIISVDTNELELFIGEHYLLGPSISGMQSPALNCSSNDTSVATIDENGGVYAAGKGTANLTIRYDGNDKYAPSEVYVIVHVIDFETYIDVESEMDLNITDFEKIYRVIKNGNGKEISFPVVSGNQNTVTYSSNDTSVATVDESGYVNATGVGLANITIRFNGYMEYQASSANVIVKVAIPENNIIAEDEVDLYVGEDHRINATLEHEPFGFKLGDFNFEVNDTSVISVTSYGVIRGLSEGTAKVTVKYESNKYVPSNATITVKVVKGATKITAPESLSLFVDDCQYIRANLTSLWENKNIYNSLKYETSNNKVVKINRDGYITAVGAGQANITVKYDGSSKYIGDSVIVPVTVSYVPTEIEVGKTFSLIIDENETLVATLNPSGAGKLIYNSSDESIVTVDNNGLVTAVGVGQANITVSFAGTKKYAPANETVSVTISSTNIPTSIDVNDTFELLVDETIDISAVLNPSNAGNLTYESTNSSIVTVDDNGIITAVDLGEADIIIRFKDDEGRFLESNATAHVKVSAIPTEITADSPITINLTENSTIKYEFSHPEAGDVEFIIENPAIVTVKNGVAVSNKVGKTNVTIKFSGNKKYMASNATVLIDVVDVETSIEAYDVNVNLTESASIGAVLTPSGVGKLTYTSSNSSIVTVDEAGIVTGVKVGGADILISFEATGKYRQSNRTVHVVVSDVETSINASDINVNVTETASINAVLTPGQAGKLTYTSTNTSIVNVDGNGVVIGENIGEADIIISFEATGKYRQSNKIIHVVVSDVETSINASDIDVNVTESASIGAVLTPVEAGKLSYTSTDVSIVTVDDNGVVSGLCIGEADVLIKFEVNGKYREATKTIHVRVTAVPTEIEVNDTIALFVDESADIQAGLTPVSGKLYYSSNDSSVASVDKNGMVTAKGEGTAEITVSYLGEGKYLPSNATVTVKVSRIPTEVTVGPVEMEIGANMLLNPTVSPRVNNPSFTYTSNDTDVVAVENGYISARSSGTALITVAYPGDEKYLPSNVSFTLTIGPRVTSIDVENDLEIGFGESRDLGACVVTKHYSTTLPMTYESSDSSIVSVDKDGRITAHKKGNATITIKFAGEISFASSNATVNVVVTTKTTQIDVAKDVISLYVDDEAKIDAALIGGPQNSKLTYQSSNIAVASIDSQGKIRANGEGTAVITVNYAGDDDYHSSSANVNVSVSRIQTKIIASNTFDMKVFETIDLNAVLTPQNGILTYMSSDSEIASVDPTGKVTAKTSGNVVVTIKFAGDRKYLASQKQVIVTISKVPTSINISDITLYSGQTLKLENLLVPSEAPSTSRYLSFDSDDLDVFDVDSKGIITTFQEGTADLTVTFKGNDAYLPSNATVTVNVIKKTLSRDDCRFEVDVSDDYGEATFRIYLPDDASGNFVVNVDGEIYGDEDNIVDGVGVVSVDELTPGDHKVTMRYTGDEKYFSVNNQTTIHIYRIKIDKNNDVSVLYTENAVYKVHLTRDTQAMEGKTVTFKVNGQTYYAKTDMLGYASIKLPKLPAKTYTITASYKSVKVTNKINSKHIIVAKDLKAKKTKDLKIKITLNKVNKKYLAKKKVTLKFKGKTYTGKTSKKGAVTFTIAKSVLAKLKVGKSYTYKVTYSKDTVSKKIKIVK